MTTAFALLDFALAAAIVLLLLLKLFCAEAQRLPPGPPADPILGHLRCVPQSRAPDVFHDWARTYDTSRLTAGPPLASRSHAHPAHPRRLLRNTAKHAAKQRQWRRQARQRREADEGAVTGPLLALDLDDPVDDDADSSAESISSLSSLSRSSDDGPDAETDPEDARYLREYGAVREYIDYLTTTRILFPHEVDKEEQLTLVLEKYKSNDVPRFRRNLRVPPSTFDALLARIEAHPIFLGGEGNTSQTPVKHQLAIALYRFGHFGNAASVESIAQWAGKSAGTVVNATRRVMIAFLSMHDEVVRWPTDAEREQAKQWVEETTCAGWRNGWLFVDGTLVPLADKPGYHGEAYFDRKSNYSLNVQLINTPNLRIVDYVIDPTGSMHDSTAFRESRTYRERDQLLQRNEWIWADSAYALLDWVITPYKKPANSETRQPDIQLLCLFELTTIQVRIRSEHAVGFLKGRFQSLRGLRQQIKNEHDHRRAIEWIRACVIIHTLVHEIETDGADEDFDEELRGAGADSDESDSEDFGGVAREGVRETAGQPS
ncbi:DDE Tnp4 domain-containing protein [Mycena chlorophos]|uniref:DDE Tnp4 domain-containing protein n=1 Tax=Mycena chlorophos TaxID=658473 RepID=A0A8H6WKQ9_MYCCL|nr:DDE Tnp4 domain-containing protein [Mycena chlorophos]